MVGSPSPIQELRTRLEKSRWQLHDGLLQLENRLKDTPSQAAFSIRREGLTTWVLLGMAAGLAALEMKRRFARRGR